MTSVVQFPLMFLSGIFFPIAFMPDWLQPVAALMPLTYLAMHCVRRWSAARPTRRSAVDALVLGGWLVVSLPDLGALLPLAVSHWACLPAVRRYVGTSGFAYPDWSPLFYPPGSAATLLRIYADRLPAVELNNTFYQQPKPDKVAAWLAATPADFRFVVKAQRGGSMRAFGIAAAETVEWLTAPYRAFGERLGSVLYRVPDQIRRDDTRLRLLLDAWPADMPLTVEFQHASLAVGRDVRPAARATARRCAPPISTSRTRPTCGGPAKHVYLRLRRTRYTDDELARGPIGWTSSWPTESTATSSSATTKRASQHSRAAPAARRFWSLSPRSPTIRGWPARRTLVRSPSTGRSSPTSALRSPSSWPRR